MKKIAVIFIVIVVVLLATVLAIPLFFKQNLIDAAKSTINKQIQAEVTFNDVKLSLFQNFPKATLELIDVQIVGENEFKEDTLINVSSVKVTMSLSSVFKKEGIAIEQITLEKPKLKLVVAESGRANWDLTETPEIGGAVQKAESVDSDNSFLLELEKIEINDGSFLYIDRIAGMEVDLTDMDFDVSGAMYGTSTELETEGNVNNFNLKYGGTDYISNTSLTTKMVLDVDYETMKISIARSELLINKLALELTGNMEFPSDSLFFDLQAKTKESGFDSFLALVPPVYEDYLKEIKTTGMASISGNLKGFMFEENYPAFSLKMNIDDGNFRYADFPEQIKNIKADMVVSKPQGILNLTRVKVNSAHAEIKNNPVDLTVEMNNLIEDPWFDGAFVGKINFDHLKDVLPLDSVDVAGLIDFNLFAKGNYSAVEKEEYEKIKMDGIVLLNNFVYDSPQLIKAVFVPKGQLDFSPENINLSALKIKVGQSDFSLSGKVSNYLNYFLKDGTLKGDLRLNSNFINLNELLRLQVAENVEQSKPAPDRPNEENADNPDEELLAFTIPNNVDVTFRSRVNRMVFDRLPITNVNGLITAKGGKLILNGLNMQMLDGELKVNGSYENTPQNQPLVDFGFNAVNFDIPMAYQSLSGIKSMIPVAAHSRGRFSTGVNMKGRLTPGLKFIGQSVDGTGQFSTENLQIKESPIFNQLRGILKPEKLKNVSVEDFKAHFIVENGNIDLKPFSTKIAGQEATLNGALSVENLLNMRLDFNIQREAFGSDIQNILSMIPGNQNIKVVPAGVIIKGPVGNPEIKMDLSETRKTVLNATKDDLQKTLDKLGSGLKKLFK